MRPQYIVHYKSSLPYIYFLFCVIEQVVGPLPALWLT